MNCKCEHWQECPTCTPHRFDAAGNRKAPQSDPIPRQRKPLDRWQIADILARERMQWTKSQPLFEFEFGEAIVRAVEREHGIGGEE